MTSTTTPATASATVSATTIPTSLKGVHALVTGGARGIGEAVARSLLAQGARVTLLGRNEATLASGVQALAVHGDVAWVSADISDAQAVASALRRAAERFGPVQVLVNNAGQAVSAPFGKTDAALWQQMIDVNLTGTFHCISAALPEMLTAGWGRIVNVASTAGLIGYPYVTAYCAAKHGVVGLTRALALEVAKKGVTVNAVCPGYTETDIVRDAVANIVAKTGRSEDDARGELAKRNPQGRLVQPQEVADAVLWLCQPGASAVTGQSIAVAGGEVTVG